jgi:2-C-methyl-D-erythritol 2,4-cyclodiphosphate synthase
MPFKIGHGVDTHQLESGYDLIIGGVKIPFHKGSKGHSDGDVLYHAIVDALLGATALGDIGNHFPSSDIRWKDANSEKFLSHAFSLVSGKGYTISNIDSTILLQAPQVSPHIQQMKENISQILDISMDCISVKATTTDHLGYIGNGDGLTAHAVVLLEHQHG